MAEFAWLPLLERWSKEIIANPEQRQRLPAEIITSGWLGLPGASEEQIRQAEVRLGQELPPSYRQFLAVSNGWLTTGNFVDRLYPAEEIDWFSARNQQWIDAYTNVPVIGSLFARVRELSDAEYFVYGNRQDPALIRQEYLRTALQISEEGDAAVYLLNPRVITPEGEWEAWFFANWLPGASRYRSFWDLMVAEHDNFLAQ